MGAKLEAHLYSARKYQKWHPLSDIFLLQLRKKRQINTTQKLLCVFKVF